MVDYPACFNSEKQFEEWVAMARKSGLSNPFLSFCVDCSYHYMRDMMKEGRCSNPDTVFVTVLNEDDEVEDIGVNG